MKNEIILLTAALACAEVTALAQGFLNLDFEQARMVPAAPGYVPSDAYNPVSAAGALPYWTVQEDDTVCTAVWGAPVALDETSVALVSAGYAPINGGYSVQLSAYADAPSDLFHYSSISQTGLIPAGTRSLQFLMASPADAGSVQPNPIVTLNGTRIDLWRLAQSGEVITMAGDVEAFAGTTATLTFLCEGIRGGGPPANGNIFNLDDIQFSPRAVPEPSTAILGILGALLLLFRLRRSASTMNLFIPAVAVLATPFVARAQGFFNLDFESANVGGYATGSSDVPITLALPGWTGTYASSQFGTNQTLQVGYDAISLGGAVISVVDDNAAQYGFGPLEGRYSVALFSQGLASPVSSTISQAGLVPTGTMSLRVQMSWGGAAPVVTLGGQPITLVPLQTFPNYTLYGGDVSSFSGQTAALSFVEPPPSVGSPGWVVLDGVSFSPEAVPEPSTFALLGLAGLLLALRRWADSRGGGRRASAGVGLVRGPALEQGVEPRGRQVES